jgi:hypothetical protein
LTKTHFWCIVVDMIESIGTASEIGLAAGYIAGQVTDAVAARHAAKTGEAVASAWGPVDGSPESTPKIRRNALARLIAPLAVIGTAAGGLTANAWFDHEPVKGGNTTVEAVVDHSFQTSQNKLFTRINELASKADQAKNIDLRTVVAHNGSQDAMDIHDLAKDTPYGPPSVGQALKVAMDSAFKGRSQTGEKQSGGIFVVTADNPIGNAKSVVQTARQNGNIRISIANVGPNNDQVAQSLHTIAKQTGGQYWAANKSDGKIIDGLEASIAGHEAAAPTPKDDKTFEKILSALAILGFGAMARERAELVFKRKQRVNS